MLKWSKTNITLCRLCPCLLPPFPALDWGLRGGGAGAALQPLLCRWVIPNMSLTEASDLPNQRRDLRPRAPPGTGVVPPVAPWRWETAGQAFQIEPRAGFQKVGLDSGRLARLASTQSSHREGGSKSRLRGQS